MPKTILVECNTAGGQREGGGVHCDIDPNAIATQHQALFSSSCFCFVLFVCLFVCWGVCLFVLFSNTCQKMRGGKQSRSQPHSPGWARVSLFFIFFLKFRSIFPQTLLIFFLILGLWVGESPTREGPGYVTGGKLVIVKNQQRQDILRFRALARKLIFGSIGTPIDHFNQV